VSQSFFDHPIQNSPYEPPTRYHALDEDGQPLEQPPIDGRRPCDFITPVPKPKRRSSKSAQTSMQFEDAAGLSDAEQEYNPKPIINEIRSHVDSWRNLPSDRDWGVTPATARLLHHWRRTEVEGLRPFFCQVEAVETVIWLTEVARTQKRYSHIWKHIEGANQHANPDLMRIAMKMATGAGKTTVMAMLIAWQTVNAVRSPTSGHFSRGFLIVAPGITIKDRLRVLLGVDVRGRSSSLRINYRTSRQIREAADRLLPPKVRDVDGIEDDRTGAQSVFEGPAPIIAQCSDPTEEISKVADFLIASVTDGIGPAEIGVFVRSPEYLPRAREAVAAAGLPLRQLGERAEGFGDFVSIGTMHFAKGLEFKAVVVLACDDEALPLQSRVDEATDEDELREVFETERHLFYVACTRARDRLHISGVTPASDFLADLS
jgi:hypothetical protein